ncbi:unnamed protein product [Cryptosporidium hominis]|uniref:Uncharacterized protein n=1 Tax=Cryptosporidium hominis TaxID=237895 RepID=A0A0S4TB17_CRYHO
MDFLREKYYSSRKFENTTIQTHLNGVSIIFFSFPNTPENQSFESIEFTEEILANVDNINGIMTRNIKISPNDPLCTITLRNGVKEVIRSHIGGELTEINMKIKNINGECKSSSWIAIITNSKY